MLSAIILSDQPPFTILYLIVTYICVSATSESTHQVKSDPSLHHCLMGCILFVIYLGKEKNSLSSCFQTSADASDLVVFVCL